jgi:hypothetical protein
MKAIKIKFKVQDYLGKNLQFIHDFESWNISVIIENGKEKSNVYYPPARL